MSVLQWVGDGCPAGRWEDFTYKVTAYALAGRGLVTVDRRRDFWAAVITDHGRYYLDHGTYQPAEAAPPRRREPAQRALQAESEEPPAPAAEVSAEALLADLDGGAVVTVADPPESVRRAYRQAISRAITERLVPEGSVLRHTGRDRGDLVIRLVDRVEAPPRPEPLPAIPVPRSLRGSHEVVRALRDKPGLLDVSVEASGRALLIAQAIADECGRRGYTFGFCDEGEPGFQITNDEACCVFTLAEEFEPGEVVDSEKLAAAKYGWQRIPSSVSEVRSGRLILRLEAGYGSVFWADRKRWTLEEKLPAVFKEITDRITAQIQARERACTERLRRRQAWEEAVPRAKLTYIDEVNRGRLHRQVARSAEAQALRDYCARLNAVATTCDDPRRAEQIREWTQWAQNEANRVDPIEHPDELVYIAPETIHPSDFEKFMPRGMSAYRPPD